MGCNCGNKGTAKKTYIFTAPSGAKKTYPTEIEARAAQIRAGGGGSIQTVSR